jgi:uncharacterized protein YciI
MRNPLESHFVVTREAGPAWKAASTLEAQPALGEHATFMNELAGEGFLLLGGPLPESDAGRFRALLLVRADDETDVQRRLAEDPWTTAGQLVTVSIEPWTILVDGRSAASGTVSSHS